MQIKTDFLILGSGIAGLSFALKVCKYGAVAIVTKKEKLESGTNYAQGGIASVLGDDDSFDLHIADTLTVGDTPKALTHEPIKLEPFDTEVDTSVVDDTPPTAPKMPSMDGHYLTYRVMGIASK